MTAAAHEFRMQKPDDEGFATRASYEGRVRRAALTHGADSPQHLAALRELEGPEFPESLDYLWRWFQELHRTRAAGMNGPEPMTHTEIDAWARLTNRTPDALEVDALLMLDLLSRHPDALQAA
ncbi:MAG: hypothetical protein JWM95_749 [Gemmatimonadetes bacterium]|nr:hypothetical protein [Gemmatimonadota bacterium]